MSNFAFSRTGPPPVSARPPSLGEIFHRTSARTPFTPGFSRLPGRVGLDAITAAQSVAQSAAAKGRYKSIRFNPQQAYIKAYEDTLVEKFGIDRAAAASAAYVAWERETQGIHRRKSFLSVVGDVLSAPANLASGFASGFVNAGPDSSNPWDFIRSLPHQTVAGYHEAGTALHEHKFFGDYVREAHPDDPVLANKWVGLTLSTIFDPVMYISFGATAGTKMAARTYLARSFHDAMTRSEKIMKEKNGYFFGTKYNDPLELAQAIRVADGYPLDLPQAMDQLRGVGRSYKSSMRQLKPFDYPNPKTGLLETVKPSPARVLGSYLLPTAVKGGRGIRFGGMEIPFTGDLTSGLAARLRAPISEMSMGPEAGPFAKALVQGFMTNPQLRMAGEDTVRALALTEMAAYKASLQGAKLTAQDVAREVARGDEGKYIHPDARAGVHQLEPPILPLTGALKRAISTAEKDTAAYTVMQSSERTGPHVIGLDPKQWQQLVDQTKTWPDPARDMADMAISDLRSGSPAQMLEVRGAGGILKAVGTFFETPFGGINIHAVASGTPGGGVSWLKKLAERYPDRPFTFAAADEKVAKYYKKMGIPETAGAVDETSGYMTRNFEIPAEDVARIAAGEDIRKPPTLRAPEEIKGLKSKIDARVEQEVEHAKSAGLREKDVRQLWQEVKAMTDDPVEAIGMFVFKNQIETHARLFTKRLLENPMFAFKVGKDDPVPIGYVKFTDPVTKQRYAILEDMEHALEDLINPQYLDRSTSAVLTALSMPQNYWKQFATSANPSFHVMNFLGAIWNNLYAGVYNPGDYVRAITALYRSRMDEAAVAGKARYMGRAARQTPQTREAAQLVREARVRGATSENASIYAEIAEGLRKGRMEPFTPRPAPTLGERARDVVKRRPTESRKRYALRQTRRGVAAGMLATGNPVGVALLAPEAATIGRTVGTTIEDVVRLAPFMKTAHDPVLLRYLDAYGPIRVPGMRHPSFSKAEQSAMYDIGAGMSKHFQFDYSDLTNFERKWAKLFFPFYTFYRKNFVLQMQLTYQAPRGLRSAQAVMNYLNENGDVSDPMQELLPEYFDQISAFQVPVPSSLRARLGLPQDQPLYLNPKLPFVSLNLMPDLWDVFRDTGEPTPQKVLAAFAPMLGSIGPLAPLPLPGMKPMLEAVTGTQLGLNKTIDYQRSSSNDWRNSYVPAPAWVQYMPAPLRSFMGIFPWMKTVKSGRPGGGYLMTATGQYVLNQLSTPFVTNLGQVIPVGGVDEGKAKADLVSWLTGVRLIPLDTLRMHRSWGYRLKSILEARRQDLKDQGKELDATDQETLNIVRQQLKVIEELWDIKQTELYGPQGGR